MIRMVNLSCRKCGMSLDEDVNRLDRFCPNCGGKLYISVSQAMDIFNDKKEIERKNVKYATQVYSIKEQKTEPKKQIKFIDVLFYIVSCIILIGYGILIWYFVAGF